MSWADLAWNWTNSDPQSPSRRRAPRARPPQRPPQRRPPRSSVWRARLNSGPVLGVGALLLTLAVGAAGIGALPKRLGPVAQALGITAVPSARERAERRWRRQLARERNALDRVLSYTPYIAVGAPNRPEIALSFDDGPGPYTPQIVRTLLRNRAPGTFFVVGSQVATFHRALEDVVAAGFPIGNHTFTHRGLTSL